MWMAAGEGLETMLSLRIVLPAMPMVAALSSAHLAALILPAGLRRLYIARDNDQAGHRAAEALGIRANAEGIEDLVLTPYADDVPAVGRARPSESRWCRKRLSPATAARGFLPLAAHRRGWRRLGCRHRACRAWVI